LSTRNHGGNQNTSVQPLGGAGSGGGDAARDFVTESERQGVTRGYAIVCESDVGMADAASGDGDRDFIGG
jgi:hypothetical protein